ncbi:PH domain-containing protein [Aquimarina algiphila]|uniref:PH domain-containing protein n=1 Tax=Aquimarina algiphila TaxID=2047982 RepID=UPI00232F1599|nr:PH domain-containing protein [Aquimarina algiphila]
MIKEEKTIWEGTPSQWTNFMFYLFCVPLLLAFGFGLLLAVWKYLDTLYNKVHVTDQRIIEQRGILSKVTNELELYRVKDIKYEQPLFLRIFGLSNIVLITTDHTNPKFILKGIKEGNNIKETVRLAIDIRRDLKGVRELDFN